MAQVHQVVVAQVPLAVCTEPASPAQAWLRCLCSRRGPAPRGCQAPPSTLKPALTFTPVEDGQGPIGQSHQHAPLHMPVTGGQVGGEPGSGHCPQPSLPTRPGGVTHTRLSTESFSLMECRHFFQLATAECT